MHTSTTMTAGLKIVSQKNRSCKTPFAVALVCGSLFALSSQALASANRYVLASQLDFGNKRGFIIDLENTGQGDSPSTLADMQLVFGIADGSQWRFTFFSPDWTAGTPYTVTATIAPDASLVTFDGREQDVAGGFTPDASPLTAHLQPAWASGPADYHIVETSLKVDSPSISQTWPTASTSPDASNLDVLSGKTAGEYHWPFKTRADVTFTVTCTFEIVQQSTDADAFLRSVSPLVDRYGQAIPAQWPEKVQSDSDLTAPIAVEAAQYDRWGEPKDRDIYGGSTIAGWTAKATGFFYLNQHKGRWWLITPLGNPCFYEGADTAPDLDWDATPVTGRDYLFDGLPDKTGLFADAWRMNAWGDGVDRQYVDFVTANLIRKYGSDWQTKASSSTVKRLAEWGFSGMGKWCTGSLGFPPDITSTPVLERNDVPNLAGHPDVFDPAIQDALRVSLRKQITPHLNDPYIVAWSIGNEYDEIITQDEIKKIIAMPDTVPARHALYQYALATLYHGDAAAMSSAWNMAGASNVPSPGASDIESMRQYYESSYYQFLYSTVKSIDPNHLYAGYWVAIGWWVGPVDYQLDAKNCDVVGYDRYNDQFADAPFQSLIDQSGKPILCGEFSFPPFYNDTRGFGQYQTFATDDADAGRLYTKWVSDAAREPLCVGVCWFQYRDEPISGRGPGEGPEATIGEHFAFGLVDDQDRPKWDLVKAVHTANLAAVSERLKP